MKALILLHSLHLSIYDRNSVILVLSSFFSACIHLDNNSLAIIYSDLRITRHLLNHEKFKTLVGDTIYASSKGADSAILKTHWGNQCLRVGTQYKKMRDIFQRVHYFDLTHNISNGLFGL